MDEPLCGQPAEYVLRMEGWESILTCRAHAAWIRALERVIHMSLPLEPLPDRSRPCGHVVGDPAALQAPPPALQPPAGTLPPPAAGPSGP